jgi:hypothetical protein
VLIVSELARIGRDTVRTPYAVQQVEEAGVEIHGYFSSQRIQRGRRDGRDANHAALSGRALRATDVRASAATPPTGVDSRRARLPAAACTVIATNATVSGMRAA